MLIRNVFELSHPVKPEFMISETGEQFIVIIDKILALAILLPTQHISHLPHDPEQMVITLSPSHAI
jgi:hypothetical protein